jgi:hypothetical protein
VQPGGLHAGFGEVLSKGHTPWEIWYYQQDFFTEAKKDAIVKWMKPEENSNLYNYRPRKNNAS